MKKKIALVIVILSIAAVANIHAFGIGAQYNLLPYSAFSEDASLAHGFALLISPFKALNIAASYYIPPEGKRSWNGVTAAVDYCPSFLTFWLFGSPMTLISNPKAWWFNATIGIGGYANFWLGQENNKVGVSRITGGIRLPLGFNCFLGNGLFEVFAHCAPSIGLTFFNHDSGSVKLGSGEWSFPVAIGARVWLGRR